MVRKNIGAFGICCSKRRSTVFPIINRKIHVTSVKLANPVKLRTRSETASLNRENSRLTEQLAALEKLTRQVKETIKIKDEEKMREEVKKETTITDGAEPTEEDIDSVFKELGITSGVEDKGASNLQLKVGASDHGQNSPVFNINNKTDLMSIFPAPKAYVELPSSVTSVLPMEALSNITTEATANWEPVIDALLQSSICDPLSAEVAQETFTSYDFHQLVSTIPRKQKMLVVEKLHELALLSGVLWDNVHVMNDLLALCNLLPVPKAKLLVGALLQDIDLQMGDGDECEAIALGENRGEATKVAANITTKAILLNHYARASDINKVREYVAELNSVPDAKNPMKTSPVIYTSIMQMYMRLDNYELAKETFDTMKFLSLSTSPSSRTYTSMILMDSLNNNIEHGISVYEEMLERGVNVESEALLALAKGCGARRGLASKGWDFIIKYYEGGYEVDGRVMEIMMYLAYADGDLPFVRGIWMNICETNTKLSGTITLPHPKCTKWLFNTYYKTGDLREEAKHGKAHVAVGVADSRVRAIRTKVLELTNFSFHQNAPPLLPVVMFDGADSKLMLSEVRAVWKYLQDYGGGDYVNEMLVEAYLYVVGRYGLMDVFESEWERLTMFDGDGVEEDGQVTIEEPEPAASTEHPDVSAASVGPVPEEKDGRPLVRVPEEKDGRPLVRVLRTDRLYNMCMHIARHQGRLSFAQKIWVERGRYRKGVRFQELSAARQDVADFKFARLMLSTLTFTGNVGDAYKLVLSSQNRFVWTRYHLKSLLMLCDRLGYTTFSTELEKVIRRGDKWVRRRQRNNPPASRK